MENKIPKVSVIIPTYNRARYLPKAVIEMLAKNHYLLAKENYIESSYREIMYNVLSLIKAKPDIGKTLYNINDNTTFKIFKFTKSYILLTLVGIKFFSRKFNIHIVGNKFRKHEL